MLSSLWMPMMPVTTTSHSAISSLQQPNSNDATIFTIGSGGKQSNPGADKLATTPKMKTGNRGSSSSRNGTDEPFMRGCRPHPLLCAYLLFVLLIADSSDAAHTKWQEQKVIITTPNENANNDGDNMTEFTAQKPSPIKKATEGGTDIADNKDNDVGGNEKYLSEEKDNEADAEEQQEEETIADGMGAEVAAKQHTPLMAFDPEKCSIYGNEPLHALMDRICELCHDMYSHQHPNMRAECRSNCFRTDNFKRCLRLFRPMASPVQRNNRAMVDAMDALAAAF